MTTFIRHMRSSWFLGILFNHHKTYCKAIFIRQRRKLKTRGFEDLPTFLWLLIGEMRFKPMSVQRQVGLFL